jgi:hypothetical protein
MDVADSADKLSEDLLNFLDRKGTVLEEMVVEFVAWEC